VLCGAVRARAWRQVTHVGPTSLTPHATQGVEPLRYQWFKDEKKIAVATADTAALIIAGVAQADEGTYHCVVSNKDGSVSSAKAMLKVGASASTVDRIYRCLDAADGSTVELNGSLCIGGGWADEGTYRCCGVNKDGLLPPPGQCPRWVWLC
jgi:hypothetical protein